MATMTRFHTEVSNETPLRNLDNTITEFLSEIHRDVTIAVRCLIRITISGATGKNAHAVTIS